MSDKSSDIEDWSFVDKDGEIELSDEGSSASSIEVVNVENDVVTYQNRRSLERSVSPTLQHTATVNTENGAHTEEVQADASSLPPTNQQNQVDITAKDSLVRNSDSESDEHISVDDSKRELPLLNNLAESGVHPQIQRELSVTSDTSNVPSILSMPSDLSDNSSDADSDYIRLEAAESLDGDNHGMTSSSVSSNFNFISRENSPENDIGDKLFVKEESGNWDEEANESINLDRNINQNLEKNNLTEDDGSQNLPIAVEAVDENDQNPADINNDEIQNLEVDNQILEVDNQRLEVDNQRLEVDNQILDVDNQILEVDNQRLEVDNQRLEVDNHILDVDNQRLEVDNQILEVDNQDPVENDRLDEDIQPYVVENHVLEEYNHVLEANNLIPRDNNQIPRDNNNLGNEDLSETEHNDRSAEVEEDQDRYTDSGTEDDRIESDQSDAGSIPPLDDDMSFVNDIGDLPLVAGDVARQYVHNPNRHLNLILDVIAILMFAVVVGLGIGHAIATFEEIEEYETLHSSIANLRSQALTCQNQKWSQKITINDLRIEQESLNLRYKESRNEQEKLRIKNTLLLLELETFRKHETITTEDNDIRLKLQNEINQLKTEKEELKQMIGQLKYTTHPANRNIGNTDNAQVNNECDKSASATKAALKYNGKRLSDFSLDDLQEIHNSESLDNSFLKQEVGRLRYTSHPGLKDGYELKSEEERYVEYLKITEGIKCENVSAIKEELSQAQRNAEIWFQKYIYLKEKNELNSTNCFKYIISNLNATQFLSSINTTVFKTWLASSAGAAKEIQSVVSEVGSKVWEDVSKTSQEIFLTISKEFHMDEADEDDTPDPEDDIDFADDDTIIPDNDINLADDDALDADDDKDLSDDAFDTDNDVDIAAAAAADDDAAAAAAAADDDDDDDDNSGQNVDDNKQSRNEADAETDSESSNDTKENSKPHAKWSDNVKDILNKTRNKMSNVSQQIKDTWQKVKNLSHQLWVKNEGKVTKTLTNISYKVAKFGKKIKDKLHRKVSRFYQKGGEKQRNKKKFKQQKNKAFSNEKIKRGKVHKQKTHPKKTTKKWTQKQPNRPQQDRKFHKKAKSQMKKQMRLEKKLEKMINKYQKRMSYKMNFEVFSKLSDKARQSELDKIYHIQMLAGELGFFSENRALTSKIENYINLMNCQDLWWSSEVIKDFPTDSQILHCSQFLPDWQMKKLLKRRRLMLNEGKIKISDEKTEKKLVQLHKKMDVIYQNEENIISEKTVSRDGNVIDESADWQFQRAHDREEMRQLESEPDWLFERANHRKESRAIESEPDWLFERAQHRKDLRYKEWEEPEWTFTRAKHREEVREEEHQPDWVFDRAHDREEQRDQSSTSYRRQRHSGRIVECDG